MPWYAREIATVAIDDPAESETDRLWRQIDPVLYETMSIGIGGDQSTGPT